METLVQTLLAFVGTMLVFALAAQSLQEVLKTMFVIKGLAMQRAVEGLICEATRAQQQWTIDAEAIIRQVVRRLRALGQGGWGKGKIRLDVLPAAQLEDLIAKVVPAEVSGLPGDRHQALAILAAIGKQAKEWYPVAVAPVDDRYRRRMRVLALLSSALVVLPFNLDAIRVFELSRNSVEFRARVDSLATRLDSTYLRRGNPAAPGTMAASAALAVANSSGKTPALTNKDVQEIRAIYSGDLFGTFSLDNLTRWRWWLGIMLSIVLVSLGAPFWHDLLESLFGLKNRLVASTPKQEPVNG